MKNNTESAFETGIIKKWFTDKNFGFIENEARESFFLHIKHWCGQEKPAENMQVQFNSRQGKKGFHAIQVNVKNRYPNPYQFVRPHIKNSVNDTPVWHDGKNSQTLLSGEIRLNMTTLTPLLVGQWQYQAKDIENIPDQCGSYKNDKGEPEKYSGKKLSFFNKVVMKDKVILEPLRLSDGRVVLPGASIKGMIRNSLSALLSAPMERVAERSYSYRPNAKFVNSVFREVRPAFIVKANENEIKIKLLNAPRSAWFGHTKDLVNPKFTGKAQDWTTVMKQPCKSKPQKNRFVKRINGGKLLGKYYFAHYIGGIDGDGILCTAFNEKAGVYNAVLIPEAEYDSTQAEISIPQPVIAHHLQTLDHLSSDDGLLASGYPNGTTDQLKNAREKIKDLKKRWQPENRSKLEGYLIYVELENGKRINSMGHHYYYRWRYTNTIRTEKFAVRDILKPLSVETENENGGQPEKLSAARLLFGYTSYTEGNPLKQNGVANIGSGVYQRLAGRIQINAALEQLEDNSIANNSRFLEGEQALPLQPLGQPRPSAVEHYLDQPQTTKKLQEHRKDGGEMLTYGDLPDNDQDTAATLAGRKFYLHQPDAAKDPDCYRTQNETHEIKNQAMLVRFVCKPGTKFRFTLSFKDLRPWELGALLLVLQPEKYLSLILKELLKLKPTLENPLQDLLTKITTYNENKKASQPLFAHKLGHARPLGFGSILLSADTITLLSNDDNYLPVLLAIDENQLKNCLIKCALKLAEHFESADFLAQWCAVHQYAGRTRAAYPQKEGEIYKYHSQARNNHISARRNNKDKAKLSEAILKSEPFNPKS